MSPVIGRSSQVKVRLAGPIASGLVALGLIVASAFLPWFEWSLRNGIHEIEVTRIWGPPTWVPGTPYGFVERSADHQRVVDVAACAYLALLLVALALWVSHLLRILSRRFDPRRAAIAVGVGSAFLCAGLFVGLGLPGFILERIALHPSMLRSTWIVRAELQRFRVEGPLLLLAGVILEAVTAAWSFRAATPG